MLIIMVTLTDWIFLKLRKRPKLSRKFIYFYWHLYRKWFIGSECLCLRISQSDEHDSPHTSMAIRIIHDPLLHNFYTQSSTVFSVPIPSVYNFGKSMANPKYVVNLPESIQKWSEKFGDSKDVYNTLIRIGTSVVILSEEFKCAVEHLTDQIQDKPLEEIAGILGSAFPYQRLEYDNISLPYIPLVPFTALAGEPFECIVGNHITDIVNFAQVIYRSNFTNKFCYVLNLIISDIEAKFSQIIPRLNQMFKQGTEIYAELIELTAKYPHTAPTDANQMLESEELAPLLEEYTVLQARAIDLDRKFVLTVKGNPYLYWWVWMKTTIHIIHLYRDKWEENLPETGNIDYATTARAQF
jgi:hypothetical protein